MSFNVSNLIDKINSFENLKVNWDSYGADPVSSISIAVALPLIEAFDQIEDDIDINVFPTRDGGVQIEIDNKYSDMELVISDSGSINFGKYDKNTQDLISEKMFENWNIQGIINFLMTEL